MKPDTTIGLVLFIVLGLAAYAAKAMPPDPLILTPPASVTVPIDNSNYNINYFDASNSNSLDANLVNTNTIDNTVNNAVDNNVSTTIDNNVTVESPVNNTDNSTVNNTDNTSNSTDNRTYDNSNARVVNQIGNKSYVTSNLDYNKGTVLGLHSSPNLSALFGMVSQNGFSCASNIGFSASFIAGIGFSFPWTNARCEHLGASAHLSSVYGLEVGCNYLIQNDDVIAKAFRASSYTCKQPIAKPILAPVVDYTPPRLPPRRATNEKLDAVFKSNMSK